MMACGMRLGPAYDAGGRRMAQCGDVDGHCMVVVQY